MVPTNHKRRGRFSICWNDYSDEPAPLKSTRAEGEKGPPPCPLRTTKTIHHRDQYTLTAETLRKGGYKKSAKKPDAKRLFQAYGFRARPSGKLLRATAHSKNTVEVFKAASRRQILIESSLPIDRQVPSNRPVAFAFVRLAGKMFQELRTTTVRFEFRARARDYLRGNGTASPHFDVSHPVSPPSLLVEKTTGTSKPLAATARSYAIEESPGGSEMASENETAEVSRGPKFQQRRERAVFSNQSNARIYRTAIVSAIIGPAE